MSESYTKEKSSCTCCGNSGPFVHGQSISLMNEESKGSFAVFLSPEDEENESYALTAYHVLPFMSTGERRVITPGGLDILTRLLKIGSQQNNEAEINFLLDQ